jgi:hypothetical protein
LDNKVSVPKLNALDDYLRHHPNTVIIDPIENVRAVVSRALCSDTLAQIQRKLHAQQRRCPFSQPKYFVADSGTASFVGWAVYMRTHKMRFPVICKPVKACGTAESHFMV